MPSGVITHGAVDTLEQIAPGLAEAIPCPLCGYDLRGLPAGRCPECGHAFDPVQLIRAAELRHPYLFEDHPRRFWWSVPTTMIRSLRPSRFWTILRPEMPPRSRLVLRYWLLMLLLCALVALAVQISFFFAGGSSSEWSNLTTRVSVLNRAMERYRTAGEPYRRVLDSQGHGDWVGTMSAERNKAIANSVLWILGIKYYSPLHRLWPFTAVLILWAWGVVLVMQVFRRTLRQAKIGTGHVLRVSLYAGDLLPLVLLALLLLALGVRGQRLYELNDLWNWQSHLPMVLTEAVFVMCVALFSGWRLWKAQLRYLRLPHGPAMVVAIETILGLAAFIFLLNARFALLNYF